LLPKCCTAFVEPVSLSQCCTANFACFMSTLHHLCAVLFLIKVLHCLCLISFMSKTLHCLLFLRCYRTLHRLRMVRFRARMLHLVYFLSEVAPPLFSLCCACRGSVMLLFLCRWG
jgi:hypothetical protein